LKDNDLGEYRTGITLINIGLKPTLNVNYQESVMECRQKTKNRTIIIAIPSWNEQ